MNDILAGVPAEAWVGLPGVSTLPTVATAERVQAMENFFRVFAIRPDDRVVFLADQKLDPRVIHAVCGLARARGVEARVYMSHTTQHTEIPEAVKPLLEDATFVVSTWFCSVIDPYCIALRRRGQRWVKITYFRNLDLLDTAPTVHADGESIRSAILNLVVNSFEALPDGGHLRLAMISNN